MQLIYEFLLVIFINTNICIIYYILILIYKYYNDYYNVLCLNSISSSIYYTIVPYHMVLYLYDSYHPVRQPHGKWSCDSYFEPFLVFLPPPVCSDVNLAAGTEDHWGPAEHPANDSNNRVTTANGPYSSCVDCWTLELMNLMNYL